MTTDQTPTISVQLRRFWPTSPTDSTTSLRAWPTTSSRASCVPPTRNLRREQPSPRSCPPSPNGSRGNGLWHSTKSREACRPFRRCCSCASTTPVGRRWPWLLRAPRGGTRGRVVGRLRARREGQPRSCGGDGRARYRHLGRVPKPWTTEILRAADVVVTMGCGDTCPYYPGKRYEDWVLEDRRPGRRRGPTDPRRHRAARGGALGVVVRWERPLESGTSGSDTPAPVQDPREQRERGASGESRA